MERVVVFVAFLFTLLGREEEAIFGCRAEETV